MNEYERRQLTLDELECSNIGRNPRYADGGWLAPVMVSALVVAVGSASLVWVLMR